MAGTYFIADLRGRWQAVLARALPILFVLLLAGALGALLYSASNASRDYDRALAEQRRSFEVIALTRRFEATMARAEVTLARYVISMNRDTGRLFQDQLRTAAGQLRSLARSTRRSDWQQDSVPRLEAAFDERSKRLSEIALRTTYDQKMGALARFHRAGTTDDLSRINRMVDRIISAERARLAERSMAVMLAGDRTEWAGRTSRLVGLALLVCILVALGFANYAYGAHRRARRTADQESERADRLEAAVALRTSELSDAYEQLKLESAERVAAEDHVRQMHKMEAVGQLTGGIAHDFNNMLAVVVGGLELAKRKLHERPADAARHLDNAMEGANRAAALTRRLLAFARSEPLLPSAVEASGLITGMVDLIDRTIGDQITVHLDRQSEDWRIFVDQHQIENAILNLCVNARDAMDGRGTLMIATAQARLAAGEIGECVAGDYVRLTVADSGCGMSPEVLARVFEPFFTTKPVGQGTGLGLSQIFGFVRQSQGEIRIESTVGEGTSVHIYLPRRTSGGEAVTSVADDRVEALHPPTRILVVEDDPRVLNQTMSALAELGHLPVACDHPAKAEKLLRGHHDIGLILSDVLMPGMTGPEMVNRLPASFRHIPVLFVTGYAGDTSGDEFGAHMVLRKPYTIGALSTALSSAISGPPHSAAAAAAE
ncbi:MAG: ATP-binding protein [Sphingobium sp.]